MNIMKVADITPQQLQLVGWVIAGFCIWVVAILMIDAHMNKRNKQ